MNLFSKRETIQQNIAFMAIMAAINIVLSVISAFVPFMSIFLFLLMPLTSALVEFFCKDRYYPIYFAASIGLSLVATLWNTETTFFYLIPSLLTGYIFGLVSKKSIPSIYSILISSLIQMGCLLGFIPLVNFIYGTDVILTFKTLLNLQDSTKINVIIPAFIFLISLIQMCLSYAIISNELKKMNIEEKHIQKYEWIYQLLLFVFSLLMIPSSFFIKEISFVLLFINIFLAVYIVKDYIISKNYYTLIVFLGGLVINIIVFATAYVTLGTIDGFLLLNITPFWISFISLIVSFLKRESKKIE
ncbi:MAG TPA: hypothetical protein DDW20_05255 [Firmicutes bacterium]|nr:hypothetical protein [Bacillota bacterium]